LIQAFTTRQLSISHDLQGHLERCLGCRACEQVCPSGVKYGELIDAARAWIRIDRNKPAPGLNPWFLAIWSDRGRLKKYTRLLPYFQRTGLLKLSQWLAPLKYKPILNAAALLPKEMAPPGIHPARYPPSGKTVQLFIGCVSSKADKPAIDAAISVLTKLGYAVDITAKQVCCGALHRHNGYPEIAEDLCAQNREQTQKSRAVALVTLASACHLELKEHEASYLPVIDVVDFIINQIKTRRIHTNFEPASSRVALHSPCSTRKDQTQKLLRLIPGLRIQVLPDNGICCGAAGSYMITQPQISRRLGQDKLEHLETVAPDILITSNTGCALQFRLLINQAKLEIEVLHPIELINRQLH
jgi:glycolate oxidase iron-sulfur subunit